MSAVRLWATMHCVWLSAKIVAAFDLVYVVACSMPDVQL